MTLKTSSYDIDPKSRIWLNYQDWRAEKEKLVLGFTDLPPIEIQKQNISTMNEVTERLERFRTFLIQYGLLDRVTDIIAIKKHKTLEEYCSNEFTKTLSLIDHMCSWESLDEGHEFWENLNEQWIEHINFEKDGIIKPMILFKHSKNSHFDQ